MIVSVILPLVTISYTTSEVTPAQFLQISETVSKSNLEEKKLNYLSNFLNDYLPYLILIIYLAGVLFLGFRFYKNIRNIYHRIQLSEKRSFFSHVLVLMRSQLNPHTFLSYIFLNKSQYENNQISEEIILHEKAHADQRHSIDLIMIELFQIIFWVNPLLIWFKKAVKLNHEFLADDHVIKTTRDPLNYSEVLLQFSGNTHHVSLSSSINYSLTKKRIVMISKEFSIKKLLSKIGLFIPVLACCIYFFNNDIVAKPALASKDSPVYIVPYTEDELIQDYRIKIRVEGNKLWVNGTSTKPENFLKTVDKITKSWSDKDLKNASIEMKMQNSDKSLLTKLDKDFSKTRLGKLSGRSILPPPPPSVKGEIVQVPPPPKVGEREIMEVPPHTSEEIELREKEEIIRAEHEEISALHKKIEEEENLSEEERKRILEKVENKEKQLNSRMREVERQHVKLEKKHLEKERKHRELAREHALEEREHLRKEEAYPEPPLPPSPPAPASPGELYPINATYYINNKEVKRDEALKIINEDKAFRVNVMQNDRGDDVVRIYF
ncbi:M56 family metallopeptidase [Christiangramia lutea]|nr:M56 family metallopeptidase [Christiangramia lutea]